VDLFVLFQVTRPLPNILQERRIITMPEKKAAKKVVGMTEGLMALIGFAIACVLGLLAQ
jgi:hypothetical protein